MDNSVLNLHPREWAIALFVVTAFTTVLTAGRAYNSHEMSLWLRGAMWWTICGLIVFQSLGLQRFLFKILPPTWYRLAISTSIALVLTIVLVSAQVELLKYTPLVPKAHDPFFTFVVFMTPPVLVVAGTALLLTELRSGTSKEILTANSTQATTAEVETDNTWPQGNIDTVHAQEHYLLIRGDFGERLIRARMLDAERKLMGQPGLRVHRSWWVAKSHVQKITRNGRDYILTTKDQQTVPIGRSRVAVLRDAGWDL